MSQLYDLENNTVIATAVSPVVGTTAGGDVDGATVNMQGYRYCTFIGLVGTEGDTYGASIFHEFRVEESDDASTWTAVADADLTTAVDGGSGGAASGVFGLVDSAAEAPGIFTTTYKGDSLYVRGSTQAVGTHANGTPLAVISIKHGAKVLPAS